MSGTIRQQIGITKRQIRKTLQEAQREEVQPTQLQNLNDDDLLNAYEAHTSAHDSLYRVYSRTNRLWTKWKKLIETNPEEEGILQNYISKYGDFRQLLNDAVSTLQKLDNDRPLIEQELKRRQLQFEPYTESDADSQQSSELSTTTPIPSPAIAPNTYMQTPIHRTEPSNLSFVDASILSKLDLPVFEGNILEFPEYWARFSTLVGDKPQLDGATKFSLLKSTLRGRALQTIKGLSITSANYPVAVEILKNHFDDRVTTRHILYTRLDSLPPCDKDGRNLFTLYSQMFALVRQFTTYEDDSKEYALGAILLNKLPRHIRSRIYDQCGNEENLVPTQLLQILTKIVRKEATLEEMEDPTRYATDDTAHAVLHRQTKVTSAPRIASLPKWKSHQQRKDCVFCSSNLHKSSTCPTYKTAKERIAIVRTKRLCYNCLSQLHVTKECPSKRSCTHCSKRHHSSICLSQRLQRQAAQEPPSHQRHPLPPTTTQPPSSLPQRNRTRCQVQQLPTSYHRSYMTLTTAEPDDTASPPRMPDHLQTLPSLSTTSIQPAQDTQERLDQSSSSREVSKIYAAEVVNISTNTKRSLLMCTPVTLFNPDEPLRRIYTVAFFDCGASITMLHKQVAMDLNLRTEEEQPLSLQTFGNSEDQIYPSSKAAVGLLLANCDKIILNVRTLPYLTQPMQMELMGERRRENLQTCSISTQPGLVIGNDYFWELVLPNNFYVEKLSSGYNLIHTRLGDIISGRPLQTQHCVIAVNNVDTLENPQQHQKLEELVQKFWSLESAGIVDDVSQSDDEKCLQEFNDNTYFSLEEGRYMVQLPFKDDISDLSDNFDMAISRLKSTVGILNKHPGLLDRYHSIIMDQLQKGIIEEVNENDNSTTCHYLPHHGVMSESSKNTKLRCVYDGSAKKKGKKSLNDVLFRGPVLLPEIAGILIRIRFMNILIIGDIEKAFLMVGLDKDSRKFTRFLWLRDPTLGVKERNIVTYVFKRVPFGLISSPFLLSGTIHYHLTNYSSYLAQKILRNFYVDNLFLEATSSHNAELVYEEAKEIFREAGMNLREFASNDAEFNKLVEQLEGTPVDEICKILGLKWNTTNDELILTLPRPPETSTTWTKRKVLKNVASIYDPLGWISPSTLISKAFLQKLWKTQLHWDTVLPNNLQQEWTTILKSWSVHELRLPRRFHLCNSKNLHSELHVFTDASMVAYSAVAYLVTYEDKSKKKVSFLMAKSRLAPLRAAATIPRLELSAIAIGAKLTSFLTAQVDISIQQCYIWSDSKVALQWTKGEKSLPVFISNRVKTIRTSAPSASLRYVPSNLNPADIGSRGMEIEELHSELWFNGPKFIAEDERTWPEDITHPTQDDDNAIAEFSYTSAAKSTRTSLFDASRFSSWQRLLNTVFTVLLFIVRKSPKARQFFSNKRNQLLSTAEIIICRQAQMNHPPDDAIKKQLRLYRCNRTSLWKSKGRINNADLPTSAIDPIYMPRESQITSLYVLHIHLMNHHCGVEQTLCELRTRVWIPKGRQKVKKTLHNDCYMCRRAKSKPYALPDFPIHPQQRVTKPQYPFQRCGMDYMGPFNYRIDNLTISKYWIILITCLNTRAIFTEIVTNMSTSTVLHVIRRFVATNGFPQWIVCDNAKVFKTLDEMQSHLFRKTPEDDNILDYCANNKISFHFIASHSPWQGGLYERMAGIFKTAYRNAIRNDIYDIETLKTLTAECTAICNSRPLTYVSDERSHHPLRPIDFLRPTAVISTPRIEPIEDFIPQTDFQANLVEMWNSSSEVLDSFWNRWKSEYLVSLREHYKQSHRHARLETNSRPSPEDYVIIHDNTMKRGQWKIGQVIGSKDQFLRTVQLRLANKKIVTRPINLISPLEVSPSSNKKQQTPKKEDENHKREEPPKSSSHPMTTRSKVRANSRITLASAALLVTLIGLASSEITAVNNQCPTTSTVTRKIIHADQCMEKGIAVASIEDHVKAKKQCWFPIQCPLGHIRIQIPLPPNTGYCGTKCSCPKWTTTCSFYNGRHKESSQVHKVPSAIYNYKPTHVCSFKKSPSCSRVQKLGIFQQIELYDGSRTVVPELHLTTREFFNSEDYYCFNYDGQLISLPIPVNTPITGSPAFCRHHQCSPSTLESVFCICYSPTTTFNLGNFSIIIRAWGATSKEYYAFKEDIKGTQESHSIPKCLKGGIMIETTKSFDILEVCSSSICIYINNYKSDTTIFLPTSIVIFEYTASVMGWINGERVLSSNVTCSGHHSAKRYDADFVGRKHTITNVGQSQKSQSP